ncbi:hypothetical protein [Granulicoccus sp. GXG6511]|uniref:hypothetical protein n=1 Tax=Granulicoccus sp. GXG6511 TaxID=3381351 RepID=UPI003D7E6589
MDVLMVLSLIVAAGIIVWIAQRTRRSGPTPSPGFLPLLEGRLMQTDAEPGAVRDALEDVLRTYREPVHPSVPLLTRAGFRWTGVAAEKPRAAYLCLDDDQRTLMVTLRPVATGTEIGMIPLHNRPDRLLIAMAGHLHARIPVRSTGTVPSNVIALTAPRVPKDLVDSTLVRSGYPVTAGNVEIVGQRAVAESERRAREIVAKRDGESAADDWLAEWRARDQPSGPAEAHIARLLQRLVSWDSSLLTQIQGFALHVRASLLDSIAHREPGSDWSDLADDVSE